MTNHLTGELLTASVDDRTLRYMLLPFGEDNPGFTNLGKVFASKGAVDFSESIGRSVNLEHDSKRPIGKFTTIDETDEGLIATVSIAATSEGNDALVLAAEGLRTGISVELTNPVIRAGRIVSGKLDAAGLVTKPAFANAQLLASDFGDLEAETPDSSEPTEPEAEETAEAPAEASPTEKEDLKMSENAAVPTALAAANSGAPTLSPALIAQAYATKDVRLAASLEDAGLAGESKLFAALSNVTSTGHTANVEQNQWLGELWKSNPYVRKYANLLNSGTLTSWKVEGWRFTSTVTVGDYAGDLAEIPSGAVTTEEYTEVAQRVAHGIKVDRKFRDFGNTEFLNSLFRAQTEGYARKSDLLALARITSAATAVTGSAYVTGIAKGNTRIVDGALEVLKRTNSLPTFAIVSYDLYREMLLTTEFDNLKFISESLGLESGNLAGFQVVPSNDIPVDTVYVGTKNALQMFELAGSPIRVDALDVSHGGSDEAIFGYLAFALHNAQGIIKVNAPV